jgi:hypothetical protein
MDCICSSDERLKFGKSTGVSGKIRSITYMFKSDTLDMGIHMEGGFLNREHFGRSRG